MDGQTFEDLNDVEQYDEPRKSKRRALKRHHQRRVEKNKKRWFAFLDKKRKEDKAPVHGVAKRQELRADINEREYVSES